MPSFTKVCLPRNNSARPTRHHKAPPKRIAGVVCSCSSQCWEKRTYPKAYKQVFIYANTVQTLPSLFTPISQALKKVKLARKTSSIIQIKVILRHDTHLKKTKKFKNSGPCFLNTNKCQGMYNTGQGKITKTDSEE